MTMTDDLLHRLRRCRHFPPPPAARPVKPAHANADCPPPIAAPDTASRPVNPPLKYHGGKQRLAQRIIERMPPHKHYVEPYLGGAAVLLAKDPDNVSEVVNDLDGRLTNLWRVLQGEELFSRFQRQLEATPFSEVEWREARASAECGFDDPVDDAVAFYIECRQSLAGRRDSFASISRSRGRHRMNEQASAWLTAVEGLPAVHGRLRRVVILNRPALKLLRSEDTPNTLFYLDPPYLPETRTAREVYGEYEMSEADHRELLDLLARLQGKVMLSGYRSPLYDEALSGWARHEFNVANNAAGGASKRRMTECLWCNFEQEVQQ